MQFILPFSQSNTKSHPVQSSILFKTLSFTSTYLVHNLVFYSSKLSPSCKCFVQDGWKDKVLNNCLTPNSGVPYVEVTLHTPFRRCRRFLLAGPLSSLSPLPFSLQMVSTWTWSEGGTTGSSTPHQYQRPRMCPVAHGYQISCEGSCANEE